MKSIKTQPKPRFSIIDGGNRKSQKQKCLKRVVSYEEMISMKFLFVRTVRGSHRDSI